MVLNQKKRVYVIGVIFITLNIQNIFEFLLRKISNFSKN